MVPIAQRLTIRANSFRPLTGMVLVQPVQEGVHALFSPPYGDGTKLYPYKKCIQTFSPPYGDGTAKSANITNPMEFSSPCGDKLQYYQQNRRAKTMSYRPLAGMVCIKCSMTLASCGFRPLTGMVLCLMSLLCFPLSFRPLTGMVPKSW